MKKLSEIDYIKKANIIHNNKYDYSLMKYNGYRSKIKIICPIHGIFEQIANNHIINKSGCPQCSRDNHKMNTKKYNKKARIIHSDKYDYNLVEYIDDKHKIKIICPKHGIFSQLPYIHLNNHGCPYCNESKGEKTIIEIFKKYNIQYETQKTFENCKYKRKLKFDFYISEYNLCIEYDGEHHYQSIAYFGGDNFLNDMKIRDSIKEKYCKYNNIKLLRIKYNDFNIIEEIIVNNIIKK
jgi:glutaredoxin/very-short-patch-repair endonuclease